MIKQILIYTRPWEVNFHIALSKSLLEKHPNASLKFVTFFYKVHEDLIAKGYNSILFTEELEKITELKDLRHIDEELYKNLNLNLNLIAGMERFLPTDTEKAKVFITKHTMVLDELITENTLSISSMYDHFVYLLGGLLANNRKGYHFAFVMAGMPPNRVIALKTPWETWRNNYTREFASNLLADSITKMTQSTNERIAYMNVNWNIPIYKRFFITIKDYFEAYIDSKKGNYFAATPLNRIKIMFGKRFGKLKMKNYSFNIANKAEMKNFNSDFIFCPLHMEPEATVLMYSPWLRNQIEMCRLISQALPVGVFLLVKENPKMKNVRPHKFYKELQKIPNVILISPDVDSLEINYKAKGVITLAGTASIEAAVLGKRSLCFAIPPFWKVLENADYTKNFQLQELHAIIKDWVDNPRISLNIDKWHEWVNGTFEGNMVPAKNDKDNIIEIKQSFSNIQNTLKFIENAIVANELIEK